MVNPPAILLDNVSSIHRDIKREDRPVYTLAMVRVIGVRNPKHLDHFWSILTELLLDNACYRITSNEIFMYSTYPNAEVYKVKTGMKAKVALDQLITIVPDAEIELRFLPIGGKPFSLAQLQSMINYMPLSPGYPDTGREFEAVLDSFKLALFECTRETELHCSRLSIYNEHLAKALKLSEEEVIISSALGWLHDVGKIAIEDVILHKAGKLTEDEWGRMVQHPVIGWRILNEIPGFKEISLGVLHHHERYDGRGYPNKLKGEEIPFFGRLMCVTDSFDAMLSRRSYKEPQDLDYARSELLTNKGKQFDPYITDQFISLVDEGVFDEVIKNYK